MAKNRGPKLLFRVCYREPNGPHGPVIHQGLWTEDHKSCERTRSEMASLYGEENARIEAIDKRTGREVFERDRQDDDENQGGEDNY